MTSARDDEDPLDAEVVDLPGGQVVPLRKDQPPTPPPLESHPEPTSRAYQLVKQVARPLPHPKRAGRVAGYWARTLAMVLPWLPVIVARELRPIGRGLRKVLSGFAYWVTATGRKRAAREGEPSKRTSLLTTSAEKAATARTIITVILGPTAVGGVVWAWNEHRTWVIGGGIVVATLLDLLGRTSEPSATPPPAMPRILSESVPLRQVEASVLAALEREGFPPGSVGVAEPMWWDETRRHYEISLSLADQLRPEHLRAVERALGARDHSIRNLATDTATIRKLVIVIGDPLAALTPRPYLETGSRSIVQPVQLGVSMTEVPFALPFAGVHMRVVMGTGGGKTSWFLRAAIDGVSACADVVIGGIDITNGPELALWRGVIQHRGFTVEDAEKVLDLALSEIDRRSKILTAIAEDDDPDNDTTEWHPGLGPYFVVFVDEFAQLAVYNGKGGTKDDPVPNLLGKCEQVVRTGRKHGVSLVMLTQRTGNDDFGSTTMSSQCGVSMAGPCDPADTVRMFGVERRDGGYTPHLLSPGVEGDIRDAGKVFIDSPMHRTPDIYRAYAPGSTSEVKRRARQRMDDGLPTLGGAPEGVLEAVEVPPVLAAVEEAFRTVGEPERIATAELLELLREDGWDGFDENKLAAALRAAGVQRRDQRWRPAPGEEAVRGYWLADVQAAIRRLA